MNTRGNIKNALLNLLGTVTFSNPINNRTTWVSTSRRLKMWTDVDPTAQPALFLAQHREEYEQTGIGNMYRRALIVGAWCYAPTVDESVTGDDLLDIMEEGIESVMGYDSPSKGELTLGGLVEYCRIERRGNLFIRDPGDIDGQALLVLPIRILLP